MPRRKIVGTFHIFGIELNFYCFPCFFSHSSRRSSQSLHFIYMQIDARVKLIKWQIFDCIYFYSRTFIKETKEEKKNLSVWFICWIHRKCHFCFGYLFQFSEHFVSQFWTHIDISSLCLSCIVFFLYEHMVFAHTQLLPRVNFIGCSFSFGYSSFIPLSAGTLVV